MTDTVTVSRELLQQAIDALNEADNVLTSSVFAEAADALRAALEQPAVEQAEKLDPLTQLQVAYVMGLRDANSAPQPAPVQEPCDLCGDINANPASEADMAVYRGIAARYFKDTALVQEPDAAMEAKQ